MNRIELCRGGGGTHTSKEMYESYRTGEREEGSPGASAGHCVFLNEWCQPDALVFLNKRPIYR